MITAYLSKNDFSGTESVRLILTGNYRKLSIDHIDS